MLHHISSVLPRCIPFYCGGYHYPLITMGSMEERLVFGPCFEVCGLESPLSYNLIEKNICIKRVIPLDIIIALATVFPPARANSLPFPIFDQSVKGFRRVIRERHLNHALGFLWDLPQDME